MDEAPLELQDLRTEYAREGLTEEVVVADPIRQFEAWFRQALDSDEAEPTAMTLSTVDAGRPSARVVLLKGVDARGFVFFTNYDSRKGRELAANPQAALSFFWPTLQRQVRIEGTVERLAATESDDYFARRPRGSRIGAWASPQSEVLAHRDELVERVATMERRYPGEELPRPEFWGGYRLSPDSVELWQGRPSRLHDRLRYRRADDGWTLERLAP